MIFSCKMKLNFFVLFFIVVRFSASSQLLFINSFPLINTVYVVTISSSQSLEEIPKNIYNVSSVFRKKPKNICILSSTFSFLIKTCQKIYFYLYTQYIPFYVLYFSSTVLQIYFDSLFFMT